MATQVGRTVSRWMNIAISDTGGVMRELPIDGISIVGVTYEEQDLTAFQDAVRGALPNMPDAPIDIHGPFSTKAATSASAKAVAPTVSGSHTVLKNMPGFTATPSTLDVMFGIRHTWETGEPQFGISGTAANGYICTKYTVNDDATYDARFVLYPGSAIPAWGTTMET